MKHLIAWYECKEGLQLPDNYQDFVFVLEGKYYKIEEVEVVIPSLQYLDKKTNQFKSVQEEEKIFKYKFYLRQVYKSKTYSSFYDFLKKYTLQEISV